MPLLTPPIAISALCDPTLKMAIENTKKNILFFSFLGLWEPDAQVICETLSLATFLLGLIC